MHIEKLAWAVWLMDGAKRIVNGNEAITNSEVGLPLYLLLGFSLENGLKSFLAMKGQMPPKLRNSHNLSDLLAEAQNQGLVLKDELAKFIQDLSGYHSEFWFRYPEKAKDPAIVARPAPAVIAADAILVSIARYMDPKEILNLVPPKISD